MPVGASARPELVRVTRAATTTAQRGPGGVRFVPLVGAQGWAEAAAGPGAAAPMAPRSAA